MSSATRVMSHLWCPTEARFHAIWALGAVVADSRFWRRHPCWPAIWPRWRRSACGGCWLIRRSRTRATYCWRWHTFPHSQRSANAVLYYILTYGLTTIGAFGVIGVVERADGQRSDGRVSGLHKRNPLLAAVMLVLFLSLAGIPPLVGFWAKFNLFAAVLRVSAGLSAVHAGRAGRGHERGLALLLPAGAQARLCYACGG